MSVSTNLALTINAYGRGIETVTRDLINLAARGFGAVTGAAAATQKAMKETGEAAKAAVAEQKKAAAEFAAAERLKEKAAKDAAKARADAEKAARLAEVAATKAAEAEKLGIAKAADAAAIASAKAAQTAQALAERAATTTAKAELAEQTAAAAAARREQTAIAAKAARDQAAVAKAAAAEEAAAANSVSNAWRSVATTIAVTVAAAAAAMVKFTTSYASFEHALNGVAKNADLSGAALQDFGKKARAMAVDMAKPVEKILDVSQAAAQLGVKGSENILKFTKTAIMMEEATDLSAQAAAEQSARILMLLDGNIDKMEAFGGVLVKLGQDFNGSESEILHVAKRLSQDMALFKPASEKVLALGAAFVQSGVQAERAGGVTGRALVGMMKAIAQGGDAMTNLQKVTGLTGDQLKKTFETDATEVLRLFVNGLQNVSKDEIPYLLKQFNAADTEGMATFGALTANVRFLNEALSTSSSEIKKGGEALKKEYGVRVTELLFKWNEFIQSVRDKAIEIGTQIAPRIKEMVENATKFVQEITPSRMENIGQGVQAIATAASVVAAAFIGLIEGIGVAVNLMKDAIDGAKLGLNELRVAYINFQEESQLRKVAKKDAGLFESQEEFDKKKNARISEIKASAEAERKAIEEGTEGIVKSIRAREKAAEDAANKAGVKVGKTQLGPYRPGDAPQASAMPGGTGSPLTIGAGSMPDSALPPGGTGGTAGVLGGGGAPGGELPQVSEDGLGGSAADDGAGAIGGESGKIMGLILDKGGDKTKDQIDRDFQDVIAFVDKLKAQRQEKVVKDWQESINNAADYQKQQDAIEQEKQNKEIEQRSNFQNQIKAIEERGLSGRLTALFNFNKSYVRNDELANKDKIAVAGHLQSSLSTIIEVAGKKNAGIGKALAIAEATINTYKGATLALATYAYYPPLAAAMAGIIVAAGMLQVKNIASTKFEDGGMTVGGVKGKDSIPAMYAPGELIAPTRSFDEVVEGTARQRGWTPPGAAQAERQGGPMELAISFKGNAGRYLDAELRGAKDLGIIRIQK